MRVVINGALTVISCIFPNFSWFSLCRAGHWKIQYTAPSGISLERVQRVRFHSLSAPTFGRIFRTENEKSMQKFKGFSLEDILHPSCENSNVTPDH